MLGVLLMGVGGLATIVFTIQLLVIAFKKGILWGLGSLFVPFVIFVFVAMHWQETKKPFLLSFVAAGVMFLGMLLAGLGGMDLSMFQS